MNERFIQEWTDEQLEQAILAFSEWERHNLTITYGIRKAKVNDIYGLPYTSSSKCAMVSNTNVSAVLNEDSQYHFSYVAISESGKIIAVCDDRDENEKYVVIGNILLLLSERSIMEDYITQLNHDLKSLGLHAIQETEAIEIYDINECLVHLTDDPIQARHFMQGIQFARNLCDSANQLESPDAYVYKLEQLVEMLKIEESKENGGYGANVQHWYGTAKPINIHAGGIQALIEYYRMITS